jgi:hypothetical protein
MIFIHYRHEKGVLEPQEGIISGLCDLKLRRRDEARGFTDILESGVDALTRT